MFSKHRTLRTYIEVTKRVLSVPGVGVGTFLGGLIGAPSLGDLKPKIFIGDSVGQHEAD